MKLRKPWQFWLVGKLGSWILRVLAFTFRGDRRFPKGMPAGFYLCLHGELMLFAMFGRDRQPIGLVSTHRDGEVIASVLKNLGWDLVRGSSTRGGARAALEIARSCRDRCVMVTPDGPRGPRAKVEPGLVQLAGLCRLPIRIVRFEVGWRKNLSSWDRFVVPLPFTKVRVTISEPIEIRPKLSETEASAIAESIRARFLDSPVEDPPVFAV